MFFFLSNQPSQETDLTLTDITDLLRPEMVNTRVRSDKSIVQRSNSSPSIGEEVKTRLELDLAGNGNTRCSTITETEEESVDSSPSPLPRPRAATISTSPTKVPRSMASSSFTSERCGVTNISPQFIFLQLYQAAGLPTSYTEKPLLLPCSKNTESSIRILDR